MAITIKRFKMSDDEKQKRMRLVAAEQLSPIAVFSCIGPATFKDKDRVVQYEGLHYVKLGCREAVVSAKPFKAAVAAGFMPGDGDTPLPSISDGWKQYRVTTDGGHILVYWICGVDGQRCHPKFYRKIPVRVYLGLQKHLTGKE